MSTPQNLSDVAIDELPKLCTFKDGKGDVHYLQFIYCIAVLILWILICSYMWAGKLGTIWRHVMNREPKGRDLQRVVSELSVYKPTTA